MGITVTQALPVIGLADRLAPLDGADPDEAAATLREHAAHTDMPVPAPRGTSDPFRWIVERIRSRREVEDLGEHPARIDWLELHVPPGGSGKLALRNEQGAEYGVKLNVVGLGYGNGRVATLSVSEDFGERSRCLRLIQHLVVRVVRCAEGPPRADVAAIRHVEVAPWPACPRCGQAAAELDPFDYEPAGTGLDLSHDDAGAERSEVHSLAGSTERQIGLTIPLPAGGSALTASISARTTLSLACDARYRFASGRHYTPVRPADGAPSLPFWALGPWP